jgi:hypothetical protein
MNILGQICTTKRYYKQINKGKTPSKRTRETKRKDPSPNNRPQSKVQNPQWGALRGKNTRPKPITSNMKQVVQSGIGFYVFRCPDS